MAQFLPSPSLKLGTDINKDNTNRHLDFELASITQSTVITAETLSDFISFIGDKRFNSELDLYTVPDSIYIV
jgi:hypothetical protein